MPKVRYLNGDEFSAIMRNRDIVFVGENSEWIKSKWKHCKTCLKFKSKIFLYPNRIEIVSAHCNAECPYQTEREFIPGILKARY